jgi:DAK2 domain fusion protein YloV
MVIEIRRNLCDGHQLKWMFAAGLSWVEHHRERINTMNVFPVPDGDTGTNMTLTIQKAYERIAKSDESHIGIVAEQIAKGALMGARGNSGTILSMLLRGFAAGLSGRELMDAEAFAHACHSAVKYAYDTVGSVMKPVEGTILTVARESAEAVQSLAAEDNDLNALLGKMIAAAHESLQRTPDLLPKLKEAGVVDSGGMGLVYLLEGMKRLLDGLPVVFEGQVAGDTASDAQSWKDSLVPDDEEGYGYDVQFLMIGQNMNVDQVRHDISALGWSPLIDGDSSLIKVHIHVHNPADPINYAIVTAGVQITDIVVENMQAQYLEYVEAREARESKPLVHVEGVAVITVVRGAGLERIFEDYGAARIIQGGQTMNPGTEDFLAAIDSLPNDEIIILPNNGNIILAAQEAARLATHKKVRVIHNKTLPQGIAALLTYGDLKDDHNLDALATAMTEQIHRVISGEITRATRTVNIDDVDVKAGNIIGLLNGRLVVAGDDMTGVLRDLLHKGCANDHELVTLYYGDGVSAAEAQAVKSALEVGFGDLEFQLIPGEQPLYPYLLSIE